MDERRAVRKRSFDVGDRRQRLVVDLDELDCILGGFAAGRDDDGDCVAGIANLVGRERLVRRGIRVFGRQPRARQRCLPVLVEIFARPRGDHTGVRHRRPDIDTRDPRVRVRRTDDAEKHHPGQLHVVDPLRLPLEKLLVFLALDRRADNPAYDDFARPTHRATAPIASTMFW